LLHGNEARFVVEMFVAGSIATGGEIYQTVP
jgi:hypothetical protein